jgi:hypothetical protein
MVSDPILPMQRRLLPEVAAWLCAAVAVFCVLSWLTDTQRFPLKANDCYQYLSIARNIQAGKGIATDLLHYDENQRQGLVPAPETVFPPGYPLSIVALELLGVDGVTAGVAFSLAAFASTLILLLYLGRLLNVRIGPLRIILFLMLCNGAAWSLSLRVYSESLFTAVGLLGLTLVIKADYMPSGSWARLGILAAGAGAVGFSYWVRYAGCFLIATVAITFCVRWLRGRSMARFRDFALVSAVLAAFVLPLWIRNVVLVGSIQGGNPLTVNKSFASLGSQFLSCWIQLTTGLIGETAPASLPSRINRMLLLLAMAGVILLLGLHVVRNRKSIFRDERTRALGLLASFVAVYVLGMTYVAKYTVINYDDPRMFYPILPVVLLLLASLFPAPADRPIQVRPRFRPVLIGITAALLASYCVAQWYAFSLQASGEHVKVQTWLADSIEGDGPDRTNTLTVAQWIETHIPANAVLIATDAQACGFVLNRPCLTARFPKESPPSYDEQLHELTKRFGVSYFLLFPDGIGTTELAEVSPFAAGLVAGQCPDWLNLEVFTEHCRVYRVVK